jgi:hypothetical protein
MNQKQYTEVMNAIDSGATITGYLYNDGGHCIMGNLIQKIGVADSAMFDEGAPDDVWATVRGEDMDMETAIAQRFGLASSHQDKMMEINDKHERTQQRRAALRAYMKETFPKTHAKYLAAKTKVDHAATTLVNAVVAKSKQVKVKVLA